jgi:anaerobic C4-dicarboxylate transporter DcuB
MKKYVYGESKTLIGVQLSGSQWTAMWIFLGAIVVVAILGAVTSLRPLVGGKPMSMVLTIQMFMLMAGAIIIISTRTNPMSIAKNEVFRAGMIAVVAVFGVAWMADTVFEANLPTIKASLSEVVKSHPWTYAVALLIVSKLVNSQAAAISAMVPVALSIGVPPGYVVAFAAACYGYYILPTYPSDLATIQFDRSGTTKIGKYVINHSFILPGLIGVSTSCVAGYLIAAARGLV